MGSWGDGPIQNDDAVNWLASKLEEFLKKTIENGTVDEKIASMHVITQLHLEPNYEPYKTCPVGYRFPNFEITECALKSIEKLLKGRDATRRDLSGRRRKIELEEDQINLLEKYKKKFEYIQAQFYLTPDKEKLRRTSVKFPE
jgi:hypothetical protein